MNAGPVVEDVCFNVGLRLTSSAGEPNYEERETIMEGEIEKESRSQILKVIEKSVSLINYFLSKRKIPLCFISLTSILLH